MKDSSLICTNTFQCFRMRLKQISTLSAQGKRGGGHSSCPFWYCGDTSFCLSPSIPRCFRQTSSGRQSALMWEQGIYLEVVNISLCPHHHFVGWDRLATGAARPAVPEQSANTKTQIAQSVWLPKSKTSSFISSSASSLPPLPSSHLM